MPNDVVNIFPHPLAVEAYVQFHNMLEVIRRCWQHQTDFMIMFESTSAATIIAQDGESVYATYLSSYEQIQTIIADGANPRDLVAAYDEAARDLQDTIRQVPGYENYTSSWRSTPLSDQDTNLDAMRQYKL